MNAHTTAQATANSIARATGSTEVTTRVERRNADGSLTTLAEATSDPRPQAPIMRTNVAPGRCRATTEAFDTVRYAATVEAKDSVSDRPYTRNAAQASTLLARRVRAHRDAEQGWASKAADAEAQDDTATARTLTEAAAMASQMGAEAARCWAIVLGVYGESGTNMLATLDVQALACYQADLADWLERHQG